LDARTSDGLRRWFGKYIQWLTVSEIGSAEKKAGNNHGTWWAAQVAAYAGYAGDSDTRRMLWHWFGEHLMKQFEPVGSAPREEQRTKSLSYTAMNLDGFALLCRMASFDRIDLWRKIETPVKYAASFVQNPASWTKPQIVPYKPEQNYFLALSGIGMKKPEYIATQRRLGTPAGAWGEVLALLLAVTPV
jgi:hypothetical protein